jgi:3-dehydroquinate dehydratase I
MAHVEIRLENSLPQVVGSFGSAESLAHSDPHDLLNFSDIVEIRLDLLGANPTPQGPAAWSHLKGLPLLFTARRQEEGGAGGLVAEQRMDLLEAALTDAAAIDVEVASIQEMRKIITRAADRQLPWIASFHDFVSLPPDSVLREAACTARSEGAAVFKLAATLASPADLARLADFQLEDHGIPVATMGMGPLAAVSRLLCAQCGSVLNYGYLGETPTAPGQWDAASLKAAIGRLVPLRR